MSFSRCPCSRVVVVSSKLENSLWPVLQCSSSTLAGRFRPVASHSSEVTPANPNVIFLQMAASYDTRQTARQVLACWPRVVGLAILAHCIGGQRPQAEKSPVVCTATRAAKVDSFHFISCIFDATSILVLLIYTVLVCYLKLH